MVQRNEAKRSSGWKEMVEKVEELPWGANVAMRLVAMSP